MDDIEDLRDPDVLRHQRRAVVGERVGWALMLLLIVAALAGFLGPGPLSDAQAASSEGRLVVEFQRYLRTATTTTLVARLVVADPGEQPRILIDEDYLSSFTVEHVRPEPEQVVARGHEVEFVFAAPEHASAITVAFDLRIEEFGTRGGQLRAGDGPSVRLDHVIYP